MIAVRDHLTEKLTLEQRDDTVSPVAARNLQAEREQHVQRPWGRSLPVMFEEQRGGQGGWSRVRERESVKR